MPGSAHLVAAFRQGLSDLGFVEGQNVTIEFRWARGHYDRLPAFATELVGRQVAALSAVGGFIARGEAGDLDDPNRFRDGRRSSPRQSGRRHEPWPPHSTHRSGLRQFCGPRAL